MSSSSATLADASSAHEQSSFFDSVSTVFSSFFPTAHADDGKEDDEEDEGKDDEGGDDSKDEGEDGEGDDGGDDEEEEEDEPEDVMPGIYEECENSKECQPAKHHFLECQERVEAGNGFKDENCVEEFFHLAHCASSCSAPRVFSKLQ